MSGFSKVVAAVVVAAGISFAGVAISGGIKYFRNFDRAVEVKGLAEKKVKSDLATWNIYFSVSGDDLANLNKEISQNQHTVNDFLVKQGFESKDIQLGIISVNDNWSNQYSSGNNAKLPHYQISNSVGVNTKNVDLVARAIQNTGDLVNQGILVTSNSINYFYNGLNNIKNGMLDEATQNAKLAAETFAKNSGSKVGKIKSANQGLFTISSPDGTVNNDTTSIEKKVRVVTSIQFFLD